MDTTQHAAATRNDRALDDSTKLDAARLRLEDFLPHRLNVLSSLVSQALTRVYGGHGITIPEWRVLVCLGQFGVMTGKAIGERTHMHKTKVSRAVAELERRKLLSRRANRSDMREAFLSLAPAGRAVYEELTPRALEFTARLCEVVAPGDQVAFDRAVKLLTERSAELVDQGSVGGQMSEVGDRRSDVRDQMSDVGNRRSDVGVQRSDGRNQKSSDR